MTLFSGGVHPLAIPLLLLSWVVYAVVAGGIGLWFSIGARSSFRATVSALAAALFMFGGHWLVTILCCVIPLSIVVRGPGRDVEVFFDIQAGQSPPFVLGLFAFFGDEFDGRYSSRELTRLTVASVFGVVCWTGMVPLLWVGIKRRFAKATGREVDQVPEQSVPHSHRPPLKKRSSSMMSR